MTTWITGYHESRWHLVDSSSVDTRVALCDHVLRGDVRRLVAAWPALDDGRTLCPGCTCTAGLIPTGVDPTMRRRALLTAVAFLTAIPWPQRDPDRVTAA